eukprot:s740_g11.t1
MVCCAAPNTFGAHRLPAVPKSGMLDPVIHANARVFYLLACSARRRPVITLRRIRCVVAYFPRLRDVQQHMRLPSHAVLIEVRFQRPALPEPHMF